MHFVELHLVTIASFSYIFKDNWKKNINGFYVTCKRMHFLLFNNKSSTNVLKSQTIVIKSEYTATNTQREGRSAAWPSKGHVSSYTE